MSPPEATSAEAFEHYVGGRCVASGRGEAWRDVKAWIVALPRSVDSLLLPSVSEPCLAWTTSGEAEFQEREYKRPWITHRIKKGSYFLTTGGAPYYCKWKALGAEPFESMTVFLELSLLKTALEEIFGSHASQARLRDLSAFTDAYLDSLMEKLKEELYRPRASPLFVQGIGQAIAIHLARNYGIIEGTTLSKSPALPGYKLRQITDWMTEHITDVFSLDQLAEQAGLSKFYFNRLFKKATGLSPSQYQISLRIDEARRLLRETKKSIIEIAMDVGYSNPSHFAQVFKKQVSIGPNEYRQNGER